MPAGSKRPYTKEKKLSVASSKATADFTNNRAKFDSARKRVRENLDPFAVAETYVRAFKDSGKRKKMEVAKKASAEGPKGVTRKTVTSRKGFDNSLNWTELSKENGVYKTK